MNTTIDPDEVARFEKLAEEWWDPDGPMKPLHRINPMRLQFVRDAICRHAGRDPKRPHPLAGLSVLDIGCSAGLVSEPLARLGARVTGLDPAGANLDAARLHAEAGGLTIDYRTDPIEQVAQAGERFDVVLALEVVEHVADLDAFVQAACMAVKPGGLLILSTINRTLRALAFAVVGAEYVLRWLPRGTHQWDKFVTPDELADAVEHGGLAVKGKRGLIYNPLADSWSLGRDTAVNYFLVAGRTP